MEKKFLLPIACVAASALVAGAILYFASLQGQLIVEDTAIDSGNEQALSLFSSFSKKSVFIVSPQMHETSQPVDHSMYNGSALFLQVLVGNGNDTIQVIRVLDDEGNFLYCVSNFGDFNKSETMEKQACLDYLSPENGALVMLEFPDEKLQMPLLEISAEKLVLRPKTSGDIGKTCFLALRIMFENSQEITDSANALLERFS